MKKKKLSECEFITTYDYCGFQRITRGKSRNKIPFTYFHLSHDLTKEQEKELKRYKNVRFTSCSNRYAPEQITKVIALFDKCL